MDMVLMLAELRRDEGVEYEEYIDTLGNPSTGCGHNLKVSPLPVGWVYPLTRPQVDLLLMADVKNAMADLDRHLPWWRTLDEVRQRVIANMCFNMGIAGLNSFHNMLRRLKSGDTAGATNEMKASDWFTQVGNRAVRLSSAMYNGVMPG